MEWTRLEFPFENYTGSACAAKFEWKINRACATSLPLASSEWTYLTLLSLYPPIEALINLCSIEKWSISCEPQGFLHKTILRGLAKIWSLCWWVWSFGCRGGVGGSSWRYAFFTVKKIHFFLICNYIYSLVLWVDNFFCHNVCLD